MANFKDLCVLAGIVSLSCLTAGGWAQENVPQRQPSGPAIPQAAAPAQGLTDASLEKMLRDMGYDPKSSKSQDGKRTYYRVIIEEETFRFVVDLSLDRERMRVWLSAPLPQVASTESVAVERLWKLLESNDDISPASFSFDKSRKRFYLNMAIDNRDITPVVLRRELSYFMRTIQQTHALWKNISQQAGSDPAPAIPAPAPAPNPVVRPAPLTAASVIGTTWQFNGTSTTVEFLADGRFLWNNQPQTGSWKQDGNSVTIDVNGFTLFQLTVQGDTMTGSWERLQGEDVGRKNPSSLKRIGQVSPAVPAPMPSGRPTIPGAPVAPPN